MDDLLPTCGWRPARCCLDCRRAARMIPIPTFLLKESIETLLPFMTVMINASLREGCLPVTQKHALVSPLLKKTSLDPNELKNYRPVSNLTFVSKVVE